jgi:hypothetical protein
MKVMTTHSNATTRREAPHANRTTRTATIINALKQRAREVLNDGSIDAQSRAIIRYALETNDPWLAELVRRADANETIVNTLDFSETPPTSAADSDAEKIEVLMEMICRSGDEAGTKSAALLVLMATLENAAHPKALVNAAKHVAFTRCAELNLYGTVDGQIAMLESELFAAEAVQC